jgi:hypothetical protein
MRSVSGPLTQVPENVGRSAALVSVIYSCAPFGSGSRDAPRSSTAPNAGLSVTRPPSVDRYSPRNPVKRSATILSWADICAQAPDTGTRPSITAAKPKDVD